MNYGLDAGAIGQQADGTWNKRLCIRSESVDSTNIGMMLLSIGT
jgi:hypothetical protein